MVTMEKKTKNHQKKEKAQVAAIKNDDLQACEKVYEQDISSKVDTITLDTLKKRCSLSFSVVREFLALQSQKVSRWADRYPQDEEISSSIANCSDMIEYIKNFRDTEFEALLVEVEALKSLIFGFVEEVKSLQSQLNVLGDRFERSELESHVLRDRLERSELESHVLRLESHVLRDRFERSELAAAKKQSLMMTFDLVRMFRFYYLPTSWKWRDMTKKCAQYEKEIAEGRAGSEQDFEKYLKPFQDKVPDNVVSLRDIMKQTNNRHVLAHNNISSVDSQEDFLESCTTFLFQDAEVRALANSLMPMLMIKADKSELKVIE